MRAFILGLSIPILCKLRSSLFDPICQSLFIHGHFLARMIPATDLPALIFQHRSYIWSGKPASYPKVILVGLNQKFELGGEYIIVNMAEVPVAVFLRELQGKTGKRLAAIAIDSRYRGKCKPQGTLKTDRTILISQHRLNENIEHL